MKSNKIVRKFTDSWLFISISISLLIILLRLIGSFEQLELKLFDFYYKFAPNEPRDERIVLIGITESDIAKLKTNRLSDFQLYQILSQIEKSNPAAVGIDIFRDHPVPPNYWELRELQEQGINALNSNQPFGHKEFLSIFKENPNFFVIGKQAGIKGDRDFDVVSPPPIPRERIADVAVVNDSDGVQRRGLIYPITQEPAVPSLSWALAEWYLEQKGAKIDGIARNNEYHLKINDTVFWKFKNFTGPYTRADEGGYQTLINWRKSDFEMISVSDVLEGKFTPNKFRNRIVIVGAYAPSLNDRGLTPLNPEWGDSPRRIYGIEAIAQVSSYIISAVRDGCPTLRAWREPWISFALLSCGLITGYVMKRISIDLLNVSLFFILLIDISLFGFFFLSLSIGCWIPVLPLILSISCTGLTYYIVRAEFKRRSDRQAIRAYQKQLENTIERRQHYRIVYNSFVALGNKIIQPLQSLLLIDENWANHENNFLKFLNELEIVDSDRYKGKKLLAQLMIEISKAKELRKIIMDLCSTSIPNLSHLKANVSLIELNDALKEALEEIRDIYLNDDEFNLDIKSLIKVEDTRISNNYLEIYRLKDLLVRIFDQPIRDCCFQEKSLPNINILISGNHQVVNIKIYIFTLYKPNNLNLFFCEETIKHYNGKITIFSEFNCLVWNINFVTS